jgi:hypothetical protein
VTGREQAAETRDVAPDGSLDPDEKKDMEV